MSVWVESNKTPAKYGTLKTFPESFDDKRVWYWVDITELAAIVAFRYVNITSVNLILVFLCFHLWRQVRNPLSFCHHMYYLPHPLSSNLFTISYIKLSIILYSLLSLHLHKIFNSVYSLSFLS